jgi:hypothetical protein
LLELFTEIAFVADADCFSYDGSGYVAVGQQQLCGFFYPHFFPPSQEVLAEAQYEIGGQLLVAYIQRLRHLVHTAVFRPSFLGYPFFYPVEVFFA